MLNILFNCRYQRSHSTNYHQDGSNLVDAFVPEPSRSVKDVRCSNFIARSADHDTGRHLLLHTFFAQIQCSTVKLWRYYTSVKTKRTLSEHYDDLKVTSSKRENLSGMHQKGWLLNDWAWTWAVQWITISFANLNNSLIRRLHNVNNRDFEAVNTSTWLDDVPVGGDEECSFLTSCSTTISHRPYWKYGQYRMKVIFIVPYSLTRSHKFRKLIAGFSALWQIRHKGNACCLKSSQSSHGDGRVSSVITFWWWSYLLGNWFIHLGSKTLTNRTWLW